MSILARGVSSYEPYLQPSGELNDPLFGEPVQYGTPYHSLAQAVLATTARSGVGHLERARSGLVASLRHLVHLDEPPTASGFDRATGSITRRNHRDFFWPPVLQTFRLLRGLGVTDTDLAGLIAAVDIERAFSARPPSNWAAVWLLGEWMRIAEGLSPFSRQDVDAWLAPFFAERIQLEQGLYQEPGHPNSYDLFTRYHLAALLAEGYDGRWREQLERLMASGLRRSLDVQLSDGSLASAHRSTGQTWTLGAQCAYFTLAARHFQGRDEQLALEAREAASRALASFVRWQRIDGPYSPVENRLPPAARVGYETYTADGHYGGLALGFLAVAVLHGFEAPGPLSPRAGSLRIEHDPTWRVIAHHGPYTVHATARPAPAYDGFGILDMTFGPGRAFHLASSARSLGGGGLFNPGLALRGEAADDALEVMAQADLALVQPIAPGEGPASFVIDARPRGAPYRYRIDAHVLHDGVRVAESTPGLDSARTLLVPYLRDAGGGVTTRVEVSPGEIRFRHGDEVIALRPEVELERVIDLPHGYENRRGLCGLLRLDFRGRREGVAYELSILR